MSKLDVTDLEVCRDLINKILDLSLERRTKLRANKKINKDEFIQIGEEIEIPLRRQHKDLTLKIYEGITNSFMEHQTKIKTVTNKLESVISKIENFNDSINFFSKIINFFGSILSTASLGVAGIPSLLTNFQAIL